MHAHAYTAEPELEAKLGEVHLGEQPDDDASLWLSSSSSSGTYFYGAVGDRIGEAAACFLARWGVDLFAAEENGVPPPPPAFASPSPLHGTTTTTTTTTAAAGGINISTTTNASYADTARIWTRALSAGWVRGLISSDAFFVQGELKRYEFARRVVELRRSLNGVIREEEREWRKLFEDGIYYTNLVSDSFCFCLHFLVGLGCLISHLVVMGGTPTNFGRSLAYHWATIRPHAAAAGSTLAAVPTAAPGDEQGPGGARTWVFITDDVALPAG
jgi:hypothetical protein